ncbi:pilin [Bathymodiolus platifrons methanotrophic gill symbiont]|uniref:pilin n=1 Tax=Bathymodiolus platifrons methanotrophic gill symbiont TaxID=113268 RepID=UPI000B41B008|nr:pilin [Bathymodiolus platifrons methanotrophic gill symbiont]
MKNLTYQKVQQGFTLIELMIVVAIIGILASLAIPAYQDYTTKAKVSEAASISSTAKTALALALALAFSEGRLTNNSTNGTLGLADPTAITSKYVVSVTAIGTSTLATTPTTPTTGTITVLLDFAEIGSSQITTGMGVIWTATCTQAAQCSWVVTPLVSLPDKLLPKA